MKRYLGVHGAIGFHNHLDPDTAVIVMEVDRKDGRTPIAFLDPRLDLVRHSPSGFSWGYEGSGPAQLALAILADYLAPLETERAIALHQEFKRDVIAQLPCDRPWALPGDEVEAWLEAHP